MPRSTTCRNSRKRWKYSRKRWRSTPTSSATKASSADLTALDQKLSGLIENIRKSAIDQATLEKAVKDLNAEIMEKVGEQLSSLSGVLSSRLTSVTLVPGLYVDGIPTIEFLSVSYNALTINRTVARRKPRKPRSSPTSRQRPIIA